MVIHLEIKGSSLACFDGLWKKLVQKLVAEILSLESRWIKYGLEIAMLGGIKIDFSRPVRRTIKGHRIRKFVWKFLKVLNNSVRLRYEYYLSSYMV